MEKESSLSGFKKVIGVGLIVLIYGIAVISMGFRGIPTLQDLMEAEEDN